MPSTCASSASLLSSKPVAVDRKPVAVEDTVAWFYRTLRRTMIDLYRRRDARRRALDRFERELPEAPTDDDERLLCRCFKRLLPSVPEQYRGLLRQIDLEGQEPAEVVAALGITRNNLTARLHRARQHLRELLSRNCRACSKHGCLDCTCGEPDGQVHRH